MEKREKFKEEGRGDRKEVKGGREINKRDRRK